MNVFKDKMTKEVLKTLRDNKIILIPVPANLTSLFQLLDVQGAPNGCIKHFIKQKICDWYFDQISQSLDEGELLKRLKSH